MTQSKSCSRSALPDRRSETPAHRFVAGVCLHCSLTSECKSPADKCPAALKLAVQASGPLSSKSFASEIWTCLANRCVSTFGGGGLRSLKIGVLGGIARVDWDQGAGFAPPPKSCTKLFFLCPKQDYLHGSWEGVATNQLHRIQCKLKVSKDTPGLEPGMR